MLVFLVAMIFLSNSAYPAFPSLVEVPNQPLPGLNSNDLKIVTSMNTELAIHPAADSLADIDLANRIHEKIQLDPVFREDDVIAVTVDQGNVDLGGIVDSWNDHHHATRDAFLAGAKTVSNHIRVRSDPERSEQKFFYSHDPFQ